MRGSCGSRADIRRVRATGRGALPAAPSPATGCRICLCGREALARTLSNSNYRAPMSILRNGWDVSGFYYRGMGAPGRRARANLRSARADGPFSKRATIASCSPALRSRTISAGMSERPNCSIRAAGIQRATAGPIPTASYARTRSIERGARLQRCLRTSALNLQLLQRVFCDHDPDILLKQ